MKIINNNKAPPTMEDIEKLLNGPWKEWKTKTTNEEAKKVKKKSRKYPIGTI